MAIEGGVDPQTIQQHPYSHLFTEVQIEILDTPNFLPSETERQLQLLPPVDVYCTHPPVQLGFRDFSQLAVLYVFLWYFLRIFRGTCSEHAVHFVLAVIFGKLPT